MTAVLVVTAAAATAAPDWRAIRVDPSCPFGAGSGYEGGTRRGTSSSNTNRQPSGRHCQTRA
jgi:hypothetical protein